MCCAFKTCSSEVCEKFDLDVEYLQLHYLQTYHHVLHLKRAITVCLGLETGNVLYERSCEPARDQSYSLINFLQTT